jgi:hypothetical protein
LKEKLASIRHLNATDRVPSLAVRAHSFIANEATFVADPDNKLI